MTTSEVVNLSTGERRFYSLPSDQAVIAAYAQSINDNNTWMYQERYGHMLQITKSGLHHNIGDWACRVNTTTDEPVVAPVVVEEVETVKQPAQKNPGMTTRYEVYTNWTHSKTGEQHSDRVAYNLDKEEAEAYVARDPRCTIVAYQDAPFTAKWGEAEQPATPNLDTLPLSDLEALLDAKVAEIEKLTITAHETKEWQPVYDAERQGALIGDAISNAKGDTPLSTYEAGTGEAHQWDILKNDYVSARQQEYFNTENFRRGVDSFNATARNNKKVEQDWKAVCYGPFANFNAIKKAAKERGYIGSLVCTDHNRLRLLRFLLQEPS